MKLKKLNLSEIKGKLSRAELKKIMAGSGDGHCICVNNEGCDIGQVCLPCGDTHFGNCTSL